MLLHPYQEASRIQLPLSQTAAESTPGQELLSLLCGSNHWLETFPCIQRSQQGKTLYIIYREAAFLIEELWDQFGLLMADIDRIWPICVFGTAQNQETVRLSAAQTESSIQFVQQSISGQSTDSLNSLCLQLDCADRETADLLSRLLETMNWTTSVAAMSWKDADFLRSQGLILDPESRGLFCYAGIDHDAAYNDCLRSLDFSRQVSLWTIFLKEGLEPLEFEWLAHEISEDILMNRMEWELSLRETMDQLHFRIINQEKSFEVFSGTGRRLYFGADDHRAAAWVLLKILFPLNY